ncbi:MAG TPA: hypothetical protein PLV92_06330, partial [Pirellulaceae bacterium]|nr:hypothetical protein [Pirellulaceae bacterium]
ASTAEEVPSITVSTLASNIAVATTNPDLRRVAVEPTERVTPVSTSKSAASPENAASPNSRF